MVFTSVFFIYGFFPFTLILYYLFRKIDQRFELRLSDIFLVLASLFFFTYGSQENLLLFIAFILFHYLSGRLLAKIRDDKKKLKWVFIVLAILNFSILLFSKYTNFGIEILNIIFRKNIQYVKLINFLGISFISFTGYSYLYDIAYKGEKPASLLDLSLYISFFPKLISGPIVLYRDFAKELEDRSVTKDDVIYAINRISIGFAKKVIIADSLFFVLNDINKALATSGIDRPSLFLKLILYYFQIYYDFSGYSDIAIGLSRLFGFSFKENFDHPYLSSSISEFWRHWHISLGSFFREYIYFPLGGSRTSKAKTYRNLMLVFLVTGIWHGAGFTFILWGILNGIIVVLERMFRKKKEDGHLKKFLKIVLTNILVIILWGIFQANGFSELVTYNKIILGKLNLDNLAFSASYFLTKDIYFLLIVAFIFANTPAYKYIEKLDNKYEDSITFFLVKEIIVLGLFLLSLIFMVNQSYSPFLYFQF